MQCFPTLNTAKFIIHFKDNTILMFSSIMTFISYCIFFSICNFIVHTLAESSAQRVVTFSRVSVHMLSYVSQERVACLRNGLTPR